MNLTKRMVHIWIGPYEPPLDWMNTWKEKHPDWEYMVFTDEMLKSRKWHNQHLIDEYYRRGTWAGVADLLALYCELLVQLPDMDGPLQVQQLNTALLNLFKRRIRSTRYALLAALFS